MAELERVFQIDQTREHLENLLPWQLKHFAEAIAQAAEAAAQHDRCSCGVEIVWSQEEGGSYPLDRATGESHSLNCAIALQQKRRNWSDTGWSGTNAWGQDVYKPKPQTSKCRSCGAEIYWGKTPAGKNCPFDLNGESHFKSCPQAGSWGKAKHSPSASIMGICQCSECSSK